MSYGEGTGPWLIAAVLCERVLQERDGTMSVIRIVDRVTATTQDEKSPEEMPPVPVNLKALITLKSGEAKGNYAVTVQPVFPSQRKGPVITMPVLLEGEDRGVNLIFDVRFKASEQGVYWFDVMIRDEVVTRIPLRVLYQRILIGKSGGTPIH